MSLHNSVDIDAQDSPNSPASDSSQLNTPSLQDIINNMTMNNTNVLQSFMAQNQLPMPLPTFNPFLMLNPMINAELIQQVLATMNLNASISNSTESIDDHSSLKAKRDREMNKSVSLDCDDPPYDNMGDVIIPSNDKEGWCRNKKYIEKTDSGYMCTVCKKVYGRYNSVSYHVTIYHRNPPIKCSMPNCQFTTREARYIHFHKYYRHGIPLPHSIDQGSRKCPHCRHVSKSPAMLEKHIRRHQVKEESREDSSPTSTDVVVVDDDMEARDRTVSICDEPMMEVDEEMETKPRSSTL